MHFNEIVEYVSNAVFGVICHQDSSVLIHAGGQNIMLCPRCSGLHAGFFCCVLCTFTICKGRIRLSGLFPKIFCASAIAILFFEWLSAQLNITHSTTESRYITGLLAGCAFGLLVMAYRSYFLYSNNKNPNSSTLSVIILITLITGLVFSQLTNWNLITLLLLAMVLANLFLFLHSIFIRVYLVLSKNHKI
jgi:uncharacterized membrane protein